MSEARIDQLILQDGPRGVLDEWMQHLVDRVSSVPVIALLDGTFLVVGGEPLVAAYTARGATVVPVTVVGWEPDL